MAKVIAIAYTVEKTCWLTVSGMLLTAATLIWITLL